MLFKSYISVSLSFAYVL